MLSILLRIMIDVKHCRKNVKASDDYENDCRKKFLHEKFLCAIMQFVCQKHLCINVAKKLADKLFITLGGFYAKK